MPVCADCAVGALQLSSAVTMDCKKRKGGAERERDKKKGPLRRRRPNVINLQTK